MRFFLQKQVLVTQLSINPNTAYIIGGGGEGEIKQKNQAYFNWIYLDLK